MTINKGSVGYSPTSFHVCVIRLYKPCLFPQKIGPFDGISTVSTYESYFPLSYVLTSNLTKLSQKNKK